MKRIGFYACAIVIMMLSALSEAHAQIDLFNKKESLKDFNYKTLMVVLENNSMADLALKEAVEEGWELSDYQFCNLDEFEKIKGDTSYYFLVRVKGIFKKEREPGIEFLSLLKGGPATVKGVDQMADILSLPFQPVDDSEGVIVPFIDAYVKIFQAHVLRVQKKKIAAHLGIAWYANRLGELKNKQVLINENDLSELLSRSQAESLLKEGITIVDESQIDQALLNKDSKTVVTLSIAPSVEQQGSYCYKMLISTDGNELFYYKKQKVSAKNPRGFSREDIRAIVF
ncbi:MAG: hypothetical protein RR555_01280 [Bacteroidales bacterium]